MEGRRSRQNVPNQAAVYPERWRNGLSVNSKAPLQRYKEYWGRGGLSVAEVKSEMFDANMLSGDVHEKVSCFKTNLTNVLKLLYLPRK